VAPFIRTMEFHSQIPVSRESIEKELKLTQDFSDVQFEKLEARTTRFHARMAAQLSIIESQRQLVELLRKVKRQRERNLAEKSKESVNIPPTTTNAIKSTSTTHRRVPVYYGSMELKNTIKDVRRDLEALGNINQTRKYFHEVKIPVIFDHFNNVLSQLTKSLNEIPIPDSEAVENVDSFFDSGSETSGRSHKRE
ncbi:hypothetical protein PFISCL1PPCAC_10791, partial [Pristionchus fissidentatus]